MAVLPRPMSSARQPPRPRRSRKRSQPSPRRWYGRSSPTNAGRLVLLGEALVGQPGEQGGRPRRRRAGAGVDLAVAGEAQQRDGVDAWRGRARCSSRRRRARRSAAGSMRTQRRPVCSSVAPAGSARASSASVRAVGPSSSATTIRHCDDGLAPEPRRGGPTAAPASPCRARTTPARTRRSGPMRSMPRRSSSAGACSRKRSASSTSRSSDAGSWAVARSAATSTQPASGRGQLADRRRRAARRASSPPASSTASGVASHTSSAVHHRPGSSSSTTSRRTSQSSYGSSGTTSRTRGTTTGSPRRPPVVAVEAGGERGDLVRVGGGAAADQRIGCGEGAEHGAARSTVAGDRPAGRSGRQSAVGEAVAGDAVDHGGVDVGDRGRVVGGRPADRRHRRGERGERRRRATGSASGTQRATGRSRSVRTHGVTSPADTVAAASRATAASQATESAVACRTAGATAARRRPGRRAGAPTPGGRSDRRAGAPRGWRGDRGAAGRPATPAARTPPSRAVGRAVCSPSQPHRCSVPPAHDATIVGAGRARVGGRAARGPSAVGGGQRGRSTRHPRRPYRGGVTRRGDQAVELDTVRDSSFLFRSTLVPWRSTPRSGR